MKREKERREKKAKIFIMNVGDVVLLCDDDDELVYLPFILCV